MPVYKLLEEMPHEELLLWIEYFKQRPIGWREDDRTMKLLQAQGVKESPGKIFSSLKAIYEPPASSDTLVNKESLMFRMMMGAVGGERIL